MEDERQKIHRIVRAIIAEIRDEDLMTQLNIIGTLLASMTGSFVGQHPDEREDFMKVLRIFTDDVYEKCEQVANEAATKPNHHAS